MRVLHAQGQLSAAERDGFERTLIAAVLLVLLCLRATLRAPPSPAARRV